MKTCPNCQFLNENDNAICVHCEHPFAQNVPKIAKQQSPITSPQPQATFPATNQPQKTKNTKFLTFAICFVVLIVTAAGFIFFGNREENNDTTTLSQSSSLNTTNTTQSIENTNTTINSTGSTENDDYIFPSDKEYLSYDILSNYTEDEIGFLCNEMYARHGYIFTKEKYQTYFNAKSWYTPRHSSMEYVVTLFNKIEEANLQIIADYREDMGWQ